MVPIGIEGGGLLDNFDRLLQRGWLSFWFWPSRWLFFWLWRGRHSKLK
jgi:hypothetical protein